MDLFVFQDTPVYSVFYLKGTYLQRRVCVLRNGCLLAALVFVVLASDATLFTQTPPTQASRDHQIMALQSWMHPQRRSWGTEPSWLTLSYSVSI